MKSVMISIKPKWCELIASGNKTIEVRKTRPKIEPPFKCYIYQTVGGRTNTVDILENNLGKVIGEFACDEIKGVYANNGVQTYYNGSEGTCLSDYELIKYAIGKKIYYWHISDLVIYDKPKELSDFSSGSSTLSFSKTKDGFPWKYSGMTRPFQSWGYVEELKNE